METMMQQNTIQNLAEAYDIQLEWTDIWNNAHAVTEETCKALLSAMSVPVETPADMNAAFERLEQATVARWMEPVMVATETESEFSMDLHLPESLQARPLQWRLTLENGELHREGQLIAQQLPHVRNVRLKGQPQLARESIGQFVFSLEGPLPLGYHQLTLSEPESGKTVDMRLIVTPTRCYMPGILEGVPLASDDSEPNTKTGKIWGPALQLYAVQSKHNWGMGDFGDLLKVVDWCVQKGAAIIGINPLHALFPHNPSHSSPYSPSSRMFFNVLYLDVEAISDFSESPEAKRRVYTPAFQKALERLRHEELVPYGEVGQRKMEVLELLYQSFRHRHMAKDTERAHAFQKYVAEQGLRLERFSLFHALQERFHKEDPSIWGWPAWPESYQSPDSPAVQEFLEANRERVEFYQYLQWQVDLQLHEVGLRCLKNSMGIGMYMDLAVGVDRGGADAWANQQLFAQSSAVGAPPDDLNQKGQDWGLPPLIPERMREEAYASFIEILRQNMRHAGALRIDHVMGLFRLFWIPPGMPPAQGTYVHYPVDELFGILALESQRNQCLVIGEDLGTVAEEVRDRMDRWGVFSYKVFYFEKESVEDFKPPEAYPELAAVAVSTHDLPTLSGFWQGQDITVRTNLDLYPTREMMERQIKERILERVGLLNMLDHRGLLPEGVIANSLSIPVMTPALAASIHRLVAQSTSKVLLVQFEDMLQQLNQINLPGTTDTVYPNWQRKLTLPLEDLLTDKRVQLFVSVLSEERPRQSTTLYQTERRAEQAERIGVMIPSAAYRFQFNRSFRFSDAVGLVPYLKRLGVTHCYASPLLKAREGSPHGYDITNHKQLNQEIGTREEFEQLAATLKAHGMGLVLDIVPNHMGAGKDNPWWMDVLENGPSSLYADYFDIDWHPLAADLQNKILLPILGDTYGIILQNGELKLRFEPETGQFWLDYYQHMIPVNPVSYPSILGHRLEVLEARLDKNDPAFQEYRSIMSAFKHLPVETGNHVTRKEERARERVIALNRLATLCAASVEINSFIQENVQDFLPEKEDPTNQNRLHRLLEQQVYRLSNWRVASDEINYRRFFDINDLVAVRVEDQRVFNDTHDLVMELIEQGLVTGLRIDHPDGLYDPAGYFRQLQEEAAKRFGEPLSETWELGSEDLPLYVLIEKILAPFERLPQEWTVHGTTGYEFANSVSGLFVKQDEEKEMTRIYEKVLGHRIDFDELVYRCKKLIMKTTLNSELTVLTQQINRLSKQNWSFRDFTLHNLRDALMEVVACFPVYRTYVTPGQVSKKDREYIDWAVRLAKRRSLAIDTSIFDFIRSVLLLEVLGDNGKETITRLPHKGKGGKSESETQQQLRDAVIRFAMKFQQYTSPVMAKGLEDTSFYRFNRLVALNEVGGDPQLFGVSASTFHHQNLERIKRVPHTLLATSTHDTKRSEDARARLAVLSEIPEEWSRHVNLWRRINRQWRRELEDGDMAPSSNAEYLFYQTLIGIWPLTTPQGAQLDELADRVEAYMIKAVREAKNHTSWINPNMAYEEALRQFIRNVILRSSKLFLDDFLPFQRMIARFGMYNSLSQTVLKLTCPGVPDLYQGTELWDFSLVDPDNRRPVNYAERQNFLAQTEPLLESKSPDVLLPYFAELMEHWKDGRIKQMTMAALLRYRGANRELFQKGAYIPLEITGTYSDHVIAFARQWQDTMMIVVVPRWLHAMGVRKTTLPFGKRVWRDTAIVCPDMMEKRNFRNLLSHEMVPLRQFGGLEIEVADVFKQLPYGVLIAD